MKAWQKIRKAIKEKNVESLVITLSTIDTDKLKGKYKKIVDWLYFSYDMMYKLGINTHLSFQYIPLPSKDRGYITYFRSFDNLMKETSDGEGLRTKTTIGRFLRQYTDMTEKEIKNISERFAAIYGEQEMFFIPNTDPDGWEAVYESGHGFSSCMVYNREDGNRYLDDMCHGEYHPARAYANPRNSLALAYLANREWDGNSEGFKVYARAIVNVKYKKFVSVYGNDALETALVVKGFSYSRMTLKGQVLNRVELGNGIVCPYLDGFYNCVEDMSDYLLVSEVGYESTSTGLLYKVWACPHCGTSYDDRDDGEVYVEEYDDTRCMECVYEDYVPGFVGRFSEGYIRREDAVEIDGKYYTKESAECNDFYYSEIEGRWIHLDYIVFTSRGPVSADNPYVVPIDIEDMYGNLTAMEYDTVRVYNKDGQKLTVHKDTDLEEHGLTIYKEGE